MERKLSLTIFLPRSQSLLGCGRRWHRLNGAFLSLKVAEYDTRFCFLLNHKNVHLVASKVALAQNIEYLDFHLSLLTSTDFSFCWRFFFFCSLDSNFKNIDVFFCILKFWICFVDLSTPSSVCVCDHQSVVACITLNKHLTYLYGAYSTVCELLTAARILS